ncbi:alpha/beta fold hydrolase [Oceaniglobus roseus]|uniref:alpha/beta fold hydrolase n=1 Tax=Oceaniglobus roseus TaxID=1737570 RepID=UPI001FEA7774|nr:alpha/beta fold hydrolase [Kandeliimicrobium roseum]
MAGLLLLLLLAGLAAAPFVAERLRTPLDPAARVAAEGATADLAAGATYYRWQGRVGGPVAVCVHGLTTPHQVFDRIVAGLVADGCRVLAYDLPGRGLSAAADRIQDRAFFTTHLADLLAHQGVGRVDLLIGYSMGGAIATCFAADRPDRVGHLVLLAPAGLFHDAGATGRFVARTPVLGDWVMRVLGGVLLRRATRGTDDLARLQRAQTRRRGFLPAVLSSRRHMLAEHLGPEHRKLQEVRLPTLALWGEEDTVIPVSNVGRLAEVHRDARQETIPGATHALPHTHAGQVLHEIRGFLHDTMDATPG